MVKSSQFRRFRGDAGLLLIYVEIEGIVSFHLTQSGFARQAPRSTSAFEKAPVPRLKLVIPHI
jgi:hypothetical protein